MTSEKLCGALAMALIALSASMPASAADIHQAARKGDLDEVLALISQGVDLSECGMEAYPEFTTK